MIALRTFDLKKTIVFYLFLISIALPVSAQSDTLYYNASWKPVISDSASFYRPPIQKEGDLFHVRDYYKSGKLQMDAVSAKADTDFWQGKVSWYNEDGTLFQEGNYIKNRLNGEFVTTFMGKKIVANYENGYFISGKQNIPSGSIQILTEKKGDSIIEKFYQDDLNGIRYEYYGTKTKSRGLSKYYDAKGELIGEKTPLPNGYFKGVEVFYNYNPMRVRDINYYTFGNLLIGERYYANGQAREKVSKEPVWSKTYFDENGKQLAKVSYSYENERLMPQEGTELFFDYATKYRKISSKVVTSRAYSKRDLVEEKTFYPSGQVKTKTQYANKQKELQVSYDESGQETNRMQYKGYNPYNGTEILKDRKATYKDGELVEEIRYYPGTEIVQSKKTQTKEVFYDKEGKVLGELEMEYKNKYAKPMNGQRFVMDYKDGDVTSIEILKDGFVTNRTTYRKRQYGKDVYKTFRSIEEYDDRNYRTRRMEFYSNGKLQSDISFKNYKEVSGKYFDKEGSQLGTYDYEKEQGSLYEFFPESDELKRMEVRENGEITRLKQYDYGARSDYGEINPVLIEDMDATCCASYYSREGKLIAKLTYKEGKPWDGQLYDKNKLTLYTFKEGVRNGVYQKLDYSQRVLEEGNFVNDKQEGIFNYYNYQGKLTKKENYSDGYLEGTAYYYNEAGKEIGRMQYEKDKPVNGKRVTSAYRDQIQYELYKNGMLIEQQFYGANGKVLTKNLTGNKKQSIAYFKDSDKKKLDYLTSNTYLDGKVIRYDEKGTIVHTAEFTNGNLKSGTVLLKGGEVGSNVHYLKVSKNKDMVNVEFYDLENNKVFSAEENIFSKGSAVFMKKLYVYMDYLSGDKLY